MAWDLESCDAIEHVADNKVRCLWLSLNPLIELKSHLLVRLIKLACLLLGAELAYYLLEELHCLGATFPFETANMDSDAAIGFDSNLKFVLTHNSTLPVPHSEKHGPIGALLFFDDDEAPVLQFAGDFLIDVLLNDSLRQFLPKSLQSLVRLTCSCYA